MTINLDSLGNIKIDWSGTPIVGIYGKKGGGKTVFGEVCASTLFTKENGEVVNKEKIKLVDIWNPRTLGRSEGLYLSLPAKRKYAIQRAKLGLKSYGIPSNILIPHSKYVNELLPMNPQVFIKERPDLPETFNDVDMEFKVVTIPYKEMDGAELCMRYGRMETELAVALTDRVIDRMNPNETTIHLADKLRKSLSGTVDTPLTNLKSKRLNTFLMKEIADMRSRRAVVGMIKPLIEEKMLMSQDFKYNLNWEEEVDQVNRISVLYQGFLDKGNALMVTFWSMRRIIEICMEKGVRVAFLVREISDIAPAYPSRLYPQEFFGANLMERIARQLRERISLIYDTQRPHLLIDSLKTQTDVNVYFNMQGQDLSQANRRLESAFGIDFTKGKGKYPALNKLEVGQCYIWDTTRMKLFFVRRVLMPCHRHWDGERNFIELWQSKGYPMKAWTHISRAIEQELRKADQELYELEQARKAKVDVETAKMMKQAEIEDGAIRERVLSLRGRIDPRTRKFYSYRGIVEKMGEEGFKITKHRVEKILEESRKMRV